MFDRKTGLPADAEWLIDEVVLAFRAQGLIIITDDTQETIRQRYTDPNSSVKVMSPDELRIALVDVLTDHAKEE